MAYIAPKQNQEQTSSANQKADGYLNVKIVSKKLGDDGKPIIVSVQKGIPLYASRKLDRTLLLRQEEAAAKGESLELELLGSVWVASEEAAEAVYEDLF